MLAEKKFAFRVKSVHQQLNASDVKLKISKKLFVTATLCDLQQEQTLFYNRWSL